MSTHSLYTLQFRVTSTLSKKFTSAVIISKILFKSCIFIDLSWWRKYSSDLLHLISQPNKKCRKRNASSHRLHGKSDVGVACSKHITMTNTTPKKQAVATVFFLRQTCCDSSRANCNFQVMQLERGMICLSVCLIRRSFTKETKKTNTVLV